MKEKKQKKTRKPVGPVRKWIERIILVAALCGFVYAAFNLYTIFKANYDEGAEVAEVRETIKVPKTEAELDTFKVDFNELQKINSDIVGYIVVLDTDISYPVVKGEDNFYYLNRTFSKASNYAGAIFMDFRQNPDLSAKNTFIYGHNVKHGTMFAELEKYMDAGFFKDHPYVYYYTPTASYKLQVFSAYVGKGDSPVSYRMDFASDEDYQNYINSVKALSRTDSGFDMSAQDHMITLYTCSYEGESGVENAYVDDRYFVHMKIIQALDGEMPIERAQ